MTDKRDKFIGVLLGESEFGKSTLLQSEIVPRFERIIFVDSQNQVDVTNGNSLRAKLSSKRVCYNFVQTLKAFEELYNKKEFRIVCKFDELEENHIFEMVYELGNVCLIIEEIDLFVQQSSKDALYKIITKGRHRNIQLIGTAQRPMTVTTTLRSQASMILTFRQLGDSDIKFFNRKDLNNTLTNLNVGEFIITKGLKQWQELEKIPKKSPYLTRTKNVPKLILV